MSLLLPTPNTTTTSSSGIHNNHNVDSKECERLYIELVQRSHGDLRQLLSSFFSFLHRRTDLYCITDGGINTNNINSNNNDNDDNNHDATTTANTNKNMGFKEGEAEKIIIAAFRQFPLRRITPPSMTAAAASPLQLQPSLTPSPTLLTIEEVPNLKTAAVAEIGRAHV